MNPMIVMLKEGGERDKGMDGACRGEGGRELVAKIKSSVSNARE